MPKVFISSTSGDLAQYREAVRDAVLEAGLQPVMMEYFNAQGKAAPYKACMERVAECDVLIVLAAHRYGWVPPDQPGPKAKRIRSITWLECLEAQKQKPPIEILPFLVDKKTPWAPEHMEANRLEQGTPVEEVTRNLTQLQAFKDWLSSLGFRKTFTTPTDLKAAVASALGDWRASRKSPSREPEPAPKKPDPAPYLQALHDQCARIDIRGLQVGAGKAYSFPIDGLYIPLTTTPEQDPRQKAEFGPRSTVPLEDSLRHPRLVIVGDPGSGKTTFLRRIAFELSRGPAAGPGAAFNLPFRAFPILIRIADLEQHIQKHHAKPDTPDTTQSPAWLAHFLAARADEYDWGLDRPFFESKLKSASTLVLLDGLDEAPSRARRENMARLFERATAACRQCRFVVTTRPATYTGSATLDGFHQVRVGELDDASIEDFLAHWSRALFAEDAPRAEAHRKELLEALRARVEIRRMARNPVMLTALAVVHWNERRLPEQRADLYESILTWLARARDQREDRESADRCLELLATLALGMQSHPAGRLVEIDRGPAAALLEPCFSEIPEPARPARAVSFLDEEEVDSGIVLSRGPQLRFWHLTFEEYLAARAVAGLGESAQWKLLFDRDRLYQPEWREVLLLLAGILHVKQGRSKVDGLIQTTLDRLGHTPSLVNLARCAGLLGAILADLRPLKYHCPDPRYQQVLSAALGIFGKSQSKAIDIQTRLEAAEALGQAGDPRLTRDNWVTLPAGRFLMGAQDKSPDRPNYDPEAYSDEPVREVAVESFQLGRYPVTVAEYNRFIEDGGHDNPAWWSQGGHGGRTLPGGWDEQILHLNRPVVNVNWYGASAYCAWAKCRLPSEQEWEYAARGTEGRKYPWGSEPPTPDRANYDETKLGAASPVGLFPLGATPEGIEDMAGNVLEWTSSQYEQKDARVLRGGAWDDVVPRYLRAVYRYRLDPGNRIDNIGFRCARELS